MRIVTAQIFADAVNEVSLDKVSMEELAVAMEERTPKLAWQVDDDGHLVVLKLKELKKIEEDEESLARERERYAEGAGDQSWI